MWNSRSVEKALYPNYTNEKEMRFASSRPTWLDTGWATIGFLWISDRVYTATTTTAKRIQSYAKGFNHARTAPPTADGAAEVIYRTLTIDFTKISLKKEGYPGYTYLYLKASYYFLERM